MIVGFVLLATNLLVHKLFGWAAKDGIRAWVQDLPFFVALFLIVLVADLVQYWTHRAYHEVPALWRLHAVHHSVKSMDWLAGSRQHILELIITRTLVLAPIFVLGFSKEVIDAYIVIVGFQAVFNHANVSVRLGPLRYVIVTPNFHHWHHSPDTEGIDRNYAAHFAFLDYAFGTAHKADRDLAERLRRRRRLRAERLLQAARVSVRLEGLSAGDAPACASTSPSSAPAPPGCTARRSPASSAARSCCSTMPRRSPRRSASRAAAAATSPTSTPARATSIRRTPTSAARRWPATRRATSSTWSSATASPGTRSTRGSCSATTRARRSSTCCSPSATPAACSAGSRAGSRRSASAPPASSSIRRAGRSRRRGSSSPPAASRFPKIGATDWGYVLARQLGHRVVEPRPALVPFVCDGAALAAVRGARRRRPAGAHRRRRGAPRADFDDDLLFTHRGLSGPAALQISTYWRPGEAIDDRPRARADLAAQRCARPRRSRRRLGTVLAELLPRRLAEAWLAADARTRRARRRRPARPRPGRPRRRRCSAGTPVPTGSEGYRKAEVTAGGVDTRDLDSRSCESRRVPGLYFIGEVVDVTGWLGGYNFQWAWASAAACARALAADCRTGRGGL